MGDDVDIRSGGAIAVDTETLRLVAARLDGIGCRLDEAAAQLSRAENLVFSTLSRAPLAFHMTAGMMSGMSGKLTDDAVICRGQVAATREMADVYELVDLRSRREMLAIDDPRASMRLQERIEALTAANPQLVKLADQVVADWEGRRFDGLSSQSWDLVLSSVLMGISIGGLANKAVTDLADRHAGIVPQGTALSGPKPPVVVAEVARSTPSGPPKSTVQTLKRLPTGSDAQVRVETYTFADGTRHHRVYIAGTQSIWAGSVEPWDMGSNWDGYARRNFASFEATRQALEMAGVRPDEPLDVVGYSQGGIVATYLAVGDEYNVGEITLIGSPTVPGLRDDQTLVQLAHTADPVAALAGGGWAGTTGSSDSIIVTREGDKGDLINFDSPLDPHMMEQYLTTAGQLDASSDPRAAAIQQRRAQLSEAVSVTSTDYKAKRPF